MAAFPGVFAPTSVYMLVFALGKLRGLAPAPTPAAVPGPADSSPSASEVIPPRLLNTIEVAYPESLTVVDPPPRGIVVLRIAVDIEGKVTQVELLEGIHPKLDARVRAAARALTFTPATRDGSPIPVAFRYSIVVEAPPPKPQTPRAEPFESEPPAASPTSTTTSGELRGSVLVAGDRSKLAGATVLVAPRSEQLPAPSPSWTRSATTDEAGNFLVSDVPTGDITVVVIAAEHDRATFAETLAADETLSVRYFIRPQLAAGYRTVVRVRRPEREEVSRRTITREELEVLPGAQGDALRAVQSLPGVARPPFGLGLLVIRGSAPFDSSVYVGEHSIPLLFHFGALSTAVSSSVLDGVEFVPGNFDARYGNAIGGVIQVATRAGRRDGHHGQLEVDPLDAGFVLEGPIGKGSFIVAARRTVIDLVLPALIPDDANLQLVQTPRYYDYQAFFDHPTPHGAVTLRFFGGDDRFTAAQRPANDQEEDQDDQTSTLALFHRADLEYRARTPKANFLLTPSYRYERGGVTSPAGVDFAIRRHAVSLRAEVITNLTRRTSLTLGTDAVLNAFELDAEAPANTSFGAGDAVPDAALAAETSREFTQTFGIYANALIGRQGRARLIPSVRLSHFGGATERFVFDPRVRAAFDLTRTTTLRAGIGLYSQEPAITQRTNTWGNPALGPERAAHISIEFQQALPRGLELTLAGFYKQLWDLAARSTELVTRYNGDTGFENESNTGTGRIAGGELLVRKRLTRSFVGWASYTYSISLRRDTPSDSEYPSDFDQRHIFNGVFAFVLPRRWRLGARIQVLSGLPYTPVRDAVFDADSGNYIPRFAARNSGRLPTFHQLSLRVDKLFVWKWGSVLVYLDVQNVYNRQPVEAWAYSYDFRERAAVGGLPIFPWLGLQFRW